ncbi:MMPL family transporter [Nitrospina watsonii]|uniref:SSD domain-containing protein n=1 Tax=Nitrospina watsonii TaxID=1323948 RepID=A0ABN8VU14_9BACT|nr:MMPL family transporter [Nitrospina watsonii]CAI2717350.1 SSD domain-containing protein [Nitrospina watsonii]
MTDRHPGNTPSATRSGQGVVDRMFDRLEVLAHHHPLAVLAVALLLAGLSVWVTAQHLTFNTSRQDLISPSQQFHQLFQDYRKSFEDFDGMIVVVEGDRPRPMRGFAEALVTQLQTRQELFSEIYYKVDTDYFRDKALLYLDPGEIRELGDKLESHHDFLARVNRSPGLNTLLESINREISAGMVGSLMTDFLGTAGEAEKDDTADLNMLIALVKQMAAHLNAADAEYRSPWSAFLHEEENALQEDGYLVSGDGRLLFVLLNPVETAGDFAGSKNSIELIRRMIEKLKPQFPQVQVGLTGGEVIASDEMHTTMTDAQKASELALIGVSILFVLCYREVRKPLLAVFSLVLGLAWSMGYTTLSVGHLNIMSVVFTTILIGLGIDFGIHILGRYREERRNGLDAFNAMRETLQKTGRGNLAGAITTAIAFGAMAFTDFIGIAELGVIAAGGILLCFVAMVLVLPACITLEERWLKPKYVKRSYVDLRENLLERFYAHHYVIIFASLAVLLASGWVSQSLRFDYNLLNMQAPGIEAVRYEMKILEHAQRASWNAAFISNSRDAARSKYEQLKTMTSVGKVESLFEAVPQDQPEKIKLIADYAPEIDDYRVASTDETFSLEAVAATMKKIRFKLRRKEKNGPTDTVAEASQWVARFQQDLEKTDASTAIERLSAFSQTLFVDYRDRIADLKASAHPSPVELDDLPRDLKKRFVSDDGRYLTLVYPSINIWEREEMETFLGEMRRIDPHVTGNAVHMYESSRLMIDGYIRGGIFALLAIFTYLLVSLRNLNTTMLVLVPTLAGAVLTLGLMDLFGVNFNMANLVILPLILGIGVVDGVHIVHRYRETPEQGGNVISKSTGMSVVLTSLTTIIGFGSLMVAEHQGVYSVGQVLSLGVGSCLITSVTLLPALMKLYHAHGWRI